jgi:hypothetical protein
MLGHDIEPSWPSQTKVAGTNTNDPRGVAEPDWLLQRLLTG